MLIVHVHVHVKPEWIEPFKQATVENARQSAQEPGVAHFEVVQQLDNPSRFVLNQKSRAAGARPRTRKPPTTRNGATPLLR